MCTKHTHQNHNPRLLLLNAKSNKHMESNPFNVVVTPLLSVKDHSSLLHTGMHHPLSGKSPRLLAYPAFSYLTTILIMSDATLGDPKKFLACYLHYNSGNPLCTELLAIEPPRLTNSLAAVAVALKAFVVALPESTHLMSKRIEFGQIVIVYVQAVTHGAQTGIIKHLINVASSTALELWLLS